MPRVYLFCNRGFGAPIEELVGGLALAGLIRATAVYSAKGPRPRFLRRMSVAGSNLWQRSSCRMPRLRIFDVNAKSFYRAIRRPAVGLVAGFNQVFSTPLIARFDAIVNLHPSVLPWYRGPVPSYWCLRHGETQTGFTLHALTERIDSGPPIWQETVAIRSGDDPAVLDSRIALAAVPAVRNWVMSVIAGASLAQRLVDPATVYRTRTGYKSFPQYNSTAEHASNAAEQTQRE